MKNKLLELIEVLEGRIQTTNLTDRRQGYNLAMSTVVEILKNLIAEDGEERTKE